MKRNVAAKGSTSSVDSNDDIDGDDQSLMAKDESDSDRESLVALVAKKYSNVEDEQTEVNCWFLKYTQEYVAIK